MKKKHRSSEAEAFSVFVGAMQACLSQFVIPPVADLLSRSPSRFFLLSLLLAQDL